MGDLSCIRKTIGMKLAEISEMLPNYYRVTLIARHRGRESGNIVLTDDNLDMACEAALKLRDAKDTQFDGPLEEEARRAE